MPSLGEYDGMGEEGSLVTPIIQPQACRERSRLLAAFLTAVFPSAGWERKGEAAVIATNSHGESRRLFVVSSNDEATEKATRVAQEWAELGPAAWCERYNVPLDWLQ